MGQEIKIFKLYRFCFVLLLSWFFSLPASAGQVEIIAAEFVTKDGVNWQVDVTLKHDDSGWDHYANIWQIEDLQGGVLGNRILMHPHVNEQPFTRGLNSVSIPKNSRVVIIKAHDNVHGWSNDSMRIDLNQAVNGRLRLEKDD